MILYYISLSLTLSLKLIRFHSTRKKVESYSNVICKSFSVWCFSRYIVATLNAAAGVAVALAVTVVSSV